MFIYIDGDRGGDNSSQILSHQIRILLNGLRDAVENDADFF